MPRPATSGLGSVATDDDAREPGLDQAWNARLGLLVGMTARLERDICGRTGGRFAAISQRIGLGVGAAIALVITASDDPSIARDDATDQRVRLNPATTELGQVDRLTHQGFVDVREELHNRTHPASGAAKQKSPELPVD